MANIVVILFPIVLLCITAAQGKKEVYPYTELPANSTVTDEGICKTMVETQGYKCEEHMVTTKDGYILNLQRIPAGQSGMTADKPPVLLQHGVFVDASIWLFNSPDESLAFILADNGFDVWLINSRGTKYSRGHTSLSPHDKAYWDWTWDELTSYDLGDSVEYVYNHTDQKMHFIGHSLGTTTSLAALSQHQRLNMLRSIALLGPTAHMNQIRSVLTKIAANLFLANHLYWLGIREIVPNMDVVSQLVKGICDNLHLNCSNLLSIVTGANCCINSSKIDEILDHGLQPTTTKNMIHLSQMVKTGKIAKYDYGDEEQNMQHYGQPSPPLYDMASIPNEFPLFLTHGGQDMLSDVNDVQVLLNDLKDHDKDKLVVLFVEDYAHADFVIGVNAKQFVYDHLMAFFGGLIDFTIIIVLRIM